MITKRINTSALTGYGIAFLDGSTLVQIQCELSTHTFNAGDRPVMIKTTAAGVTSFSYPDISSIPSHASRSVTGIGGGISAAGHYYFFTIVTDPANTSVDNGTYVHRSTNQGATWTVTQLTTSTRTFPFGKMIELPGKLIQTFYEKTYESTNGGVTWGNPISIGSGISETVLVNIDNTNLLAFSRTDAASNSKMFKSTNAGVSWALMGELTGIVLGTNPPSGIKWDGPVADKKGAEISVVFSDRYNLNLVKISVSSGYHTLANWNAAPRQIIGSTLRAVQGAQLEFQGNDLLNDGADSFVVWHDVSVLCPTPLDSDNLQTDLITTKITDKGRFHSRTDATTFSGTTTVTHHIIMADTDAKLDYSDRQTIIERVGGKTYNFSANIGFNSGDGSATTIQIFKNGVLFASVTNNETSAPFLCLSGEITLAVLDEIQFKIIVGSGTRTVSGEHLNHFSLFEV